MTGPTNSAAPCRPSDHRARHLQLVPAPGAAGGEVATRAQLLAEEAELLAASEQRAREVFEPRPAEVAPLNALEEVAPVQPFETWAEESDRPATYPRAQKLARFAQGLPGPAAVQAVHPTHSAVRRGATPR